MPKEINKVSTTHPIHINTFRVCMVYGVWCKNHHRKERNFCRAPRTHTRTRPHLLTGTYKEIIRMVDSGRCMVYGVRMVNGVRCMVYGVDKNIYLQAHSQLCSRRHTLNSFCIDLCTKTHTHPHPCTHTHRDTHRHIHAHIHIYIYIYH